MSDDGVRRRARWRKCDIPMQRCRWCLTTAPPLDGDGSFCRNITLPADAYDVLFASFWPTADSDGIAGEAVDHHGGSVSVSDSIQASLDEWSPGETPTVSERASESTPRPNPGTSMMIMVEAEVNQDKDDSSAPPYRDQFRYHPYRGLGSTSQSGSCHRFRRVLSFEEGRRWHLRGGRQRCMFRHLRFCFRRA